MKTRQASYFVDYQQRAKEFAVGDVVSHVSAAYHHLHGRVMAVHPAIGMVDVEWPNGNETLPVEDLQRYTSEGIPAPPKVDHDNVPGGAAKVSVPGGPERPHIRVDASGESSLKRVVDSYVKKALYWAAPDRLYKATSQECASGRYGCPRCRSAELRPASYKREGGVSEKLLGCPQCLFLIKRQAILGHPEYNEAPGKKASKLEDAPLKHGFTRVRNTGVK